MHKSLNFGILFALTVAGAVAQDADPPSRVARLNFLSGTVSFRPASVEDWTAAALNFPLTTGDHLWTDPGGRTELHVGSTAIRMGDETALAILNLDDRTVQLSLTGGVLNVHIRNLDPDESFEVDTPNVALALLRPGDYHIEVPAGADSDQNVTVVTARGGEVEVTGGGASFTVHPGQTARVSGTDTVSQEVMAAISPDGFDRWCETRERREESSVSAAYVPRDMIGYEDLDEYGRWRLVEPYGWVWTPTNVVAGWAPYHYGRWAWVDPWGWTWVDEAPWGFAPFHYGRWAFASGAWVWVPGRMVVGVRPVYAPALVAFVGGPRFGVGIAVGGGGGMAAWFPLGPGEVYRPAYHVSDRYVRNVNIVHVTNVTVINNVNVTNVRYVNREVPGGVTAVSHETFVSARPVGGAAVRVDVREVSQAQVIGSTAMIPPRRESVVGGPIRTNVPAGRMERQVVVRNAPPPPPVSFAAKQQALQANQGRPLDTNTVNTLRNNNPPRGPMVRTVDSSPRNAPPPRNDRPIGAPRNMQTPPDVRTQRPVNQTMPPPVRQNDPAIRTDRPVNQTPPLTKQSEPPVRTDRPVNQTPPARGEEPAVRTERPTQQTPPPARKDAPQEDRRGRGPAKKGTSR
jgi:hypothetical protein